MADPNVAIAAVLEHEGGFVDDPADPGGATNFGITQADLDAGALQVQPAPAGQDVRTLTAEAAAAWYREHFWSRALGAIADQALANKLFDMMVLAGPETAKRILQDLVGAPADGCLGPRTVTLVNARDAGTLLAQFQAAMAAHFRAIAEKHPGEEKFLQGWINRVNS